MTSLAWRKNGLLLFVFGAVVVLVAALFGAPLAASSQGQKVDQGRDGTPVILVEDTAVLRLVPGEARVEPGVAAEYEVRVTNTHTAAITVTLDSLLADQVHFGWRLVPTMHTGVVSDSFVTSTLWVTPSLTPVAMAGISTTALLTAALDYTTTLYTDMVATVVAPIYGLLLTVPGRRSGQPGGL